MKILVKTTVNYTTDDADWSIRNFDWLANTLSSIDNTVVVAHDRKVNDQADPELLNLPQSDFDQLWFIGLDGGNSLLAGEAEAIHAFRRLGGAVLLTRDHQDMGKGFLALGALGHLHNFNQANPPSDLSRQASDDTYNTGISWPNYHSGSNGEAQEVSATEPLHPIAQRPDQQPLRWLPAHPHEGSISVTPELQDVAQVVLQGKSQCSGNTFNIAIAVENQTDTDGQALGRAVCESSFHHFCSYNLDTTHSCPSFVIDQPLNTLKDHSEALADTQQYVINLANWLGTRTHSA
ncbi:MAG: hypothetical protein WBP46_18675 [Thiolinea sp.]